MFEKCSQNPNMTKQASPRSGANDLNTQDKKTIEIVIKNQKSAQTALKTAFVIQNNKYMVKIQPDDSSATQNDKYDKSDKTFDD